MKQVSRDISAIICTYTEQRWDMLLAAVNSVRAQSLQPREIILVVDYNPALLARAVEQFPDVVVVENRETRGLSGARNSGVAVAQGALLAFLDDDATAEPMWLVSLVECCDDPVVLGAGTKVSPVWETRRPAWFPEEFYWVVGCTYRGLPHTTATIRNLFGGSMCLRREIFTEVGGFSDNVGRTSVRPMGCEETELCIRARQRWPEKVFLYQPHVSVQHWVPASRVHWNYFRARCFAEGQSKALVARTVGASHGLSSEWAYTWKTLPQGIVRGLVDVVKGDVMGLARAGAIVAGLIITTAGYLQQSVVQHIAKRRRVTDSNIAVAAHQSHS
jgi:glucosyl-dolichyl phosphate glucuronosyltransferase